MTAPGRFGFLRSRSGLLLVGELVVCCAVAVYFFLTFFGFTGGMLDDDYTEFDVAASEEVYAVRGALLTDAMRFVSALGAEFALVLLVVVAVGLVMRRHVREAVLLVVATAGGLGLNLVIKDLVGRPRPELSPLDAEGFASYPSGHSMNAFVFYLLLAYLAWHLLPSKLAATGVLVASTVLVVSIGASRVYLGVHYPTDVMAGYIVGAWWLLSVVVIHRLVIAHERHGRRRAPDRTAAG